MRCNFLLLAALAAARACAASPSANEAHEIDESAGHGNIFEEDEFDFVSHPYKSNGFILASNVTGPGCDGTSDLIAEATGLFLQGYHTGAGTAAAILHEPDGKHDGHIFYLNGSRGDHMSILTDAGQPQVPYGLVMPQVAGSHTTLDDEEEYVYDFYEPFEDPHHDAVTFRAGPGTPAIMGTANVGVINLQGTGTFLACNRSLPYSRNSWAITVNYLYVNGDGDGIASRCANGITPAGVPAGIPDHCVPITLLALCEKLPPAQVGGYSSHSASHPVSCYYPDDDAEHAMDWLHEDSEEEEAETEHEAGQPEVEAEHAEPEHEANAENTEAEQPTEQTQQPPSEKTEL